MKLEQYISHLYQKEEDRMTRLIFMGTPRFACSVLEQLIRDQYNIVAVVTQPDKKVGRAQAITYSAVKELALAHQIPVLQPVKMKEEYESILEYKPDIIVTCAYGQMLPEAIFAYPHLGCINVHASLLPRLRGGAPIHKAIIYGEKQTGVTLMRTVKKMDAGDMCGSLETNIELADTYGSLHDRLMGLAADLIHQKLPAIMEQTAVFAPQQEEQATVAYAITKEEEKLDFSKSWIEVYNHIRGMIPSPVAHGIIQGKKLKIWGVVLGEQQQDATANGTVCGYDQTGIKIKANDGYLYVTEVQLEGKTRMQAKEFMNGYGRNLIGERFE